MWGGGLGGGGVRGDGSGLVSECRPCGGTSCKGCTCRLTQCKVICTHYTGPGLGVSSCKAARDGRG